MICLSSAILESFGGLAHLMFSIERREWSMVLSTHCFFLGAEKTSYGKTFDEVLLIFLVMGVPVRVVV